MQFLPACLAATVIGLLFAPYYSLPPAIDGLLVAALLGGALLFRRRNLLALMLLCCAVGLMAQLLYGQQVHASATVGQVARLNRKLQVKGVVLDLRQRTAGRCSIDLRVLELHGREAAQPLAEPFRLRLFVDRGNAALLPGDVVVFKGRIRKPRLFGTPGEFNWPLYLASQHIQATSWLSDAADLQLVQRGGGSLYRLVASWRQRSAMFVTQQLAAPRAQLVRALVLGEARQLPEQVRKLLAEAGVSHLFAISGLHLGLLAVIGYRVLLFGYRRSPRLLLWQPPQRVLPLLLLPLLLLYLLLTGDAIATRRAFGLALLAVVLLLWRRTVSPLQLLFLLALASLLVNPLLLWQASWQLSFAGAAGILCWRPFWQQQLSTLPAYCRGGVRLLSVTCIASLATLPLVLLNFHLLAPGGVLANLVCVPLVALLALPVGLLGLLSQPLCAALAVLLFQLCGYLLGLVLTFVGWLTALPGLSGQPLFLSRSGLVALTLAVLPVVLFWQLSKANRLAILTTLGSLSVLLACRPVAGPERASLTMFSVGQGESLLLRSGAGKNLLIDGGGLYSDRFDVGERLLAPACAVLGVHRFDAVVLSHDHPDHRKGLLFILENFPVAEFWSGVAPAALDPALQKILREKSIPVRLLPVGWHEIGLGSLSLMSFRAAGGSLNENDSSLVLYARDGDDGLLLTGDLEAEGVRQLLRAGIPGPVTLLKLPHHGSRHSDSERLVNRLHPKVCLVSAGYQNRYRLPAGELVSFIEGQGVPLYRTDWQGTIQADLSARGWQVEPWSQGLFD